MENNKIIYEYQIETTITILTNNSNAYATTVATKIKDNSIKTVTSYI